MRYLITVLLFFLPFAAFCQAEVPGSEDMNTTDPPNLSWVEGEFRVMVVEGIFAVLKPLGQPLMPNLIKVRVSPAFLFKNRIFKANPLGRLKLTIKEGHVIKAEKPK